jgi:hypothetical protein
MKAQKTSIGSDQARDETYKERNFVKLKMKWFRIRTPGMCGYDSYDRKARHLEMTRL